MDNFEQSETPHQNLWTDGDSNPRPPHCPDNFGGTILKLARTIFSPPAGGEEKPQKI